MRKQESVHLHALLVETAEYIDERARTPPVDLGSYREMDVGPASVHRSKGDHEEAVLALASAVARSLDRSAEPPIR